MPVWRVELYKTDERKGLPTKVGHVRANTREEALEAINAALALSSSKTAACSLTMLPKGAGLPQGKIVWMPSGAALPRLEKLDRDLKRRRIRTRV